MVFIDKGGSNIGTRRKGQSQRSLKYFREATELAVERKQDGPERIGPAEKDDQCGDEDRIRHECDEARTQIAPPEEQHAPKRVRE